MKSERSFARDPAFASFFVFLGNENRKSDMVNTNQIYFDFDFLFVCSCFEDISCYLSFLCCIILSFLGVLRLEKKKASAVGVDFDFKISIFELKIIN